MTPLLTQVQQPIGSSGIILLGNESWNSDEYNVDLASPQLAVKTFDRMVRSDAQVRASLNCLLYALRSAEWRIDAAKEDPEGEKIADFVRSVLMPGETYGYAGGTPFGKTLWNLLKATVNGFSVLEKVWGYRPRDGKQVYAALEVRRAKTIRNFEFTTSGPSRITAVVQHAQFRDGRTDDVRIPAKLLIHFPFNAEGDDPWGDSILRPAHNHWRVKKDMILFDAIQKERLGGIYYLQVREGQTPTNDQVKEGKAMLEAFRLHQKQGLYVPSAFELKAIFPQGEGGKFIESIEYHDQQIERSMMAQFQSLGTGDKGALSVGQVQSDMMLLGYQGMAKAIEDVLGEQAVVDLVDTNFGPREFYPRVACENFLQMKPDRQAEVMQPLLASGAIRIDKPLRVYMRSRLSLPPEDEATMEPVPGQLLLPAGGGQDQPGTTSQPERGNGGKPGAPAEKVRKAAGPAVEPYYSLRRDRLAHEHGVAFEEMQQYLDQAPSKLWFRDVLPIREKQIRALALSAATATEAQLVSGAVARPLLPELSDAILPGLLDAYRKGRRTVLDEALRARGIAKAQRKDDLEDEYPAEPTKKQATWIQRLAQGLALGMTLALVKEATRSGQEAQDQELDQAEREAMVRRALEQLSEPMVRADLSGTLTKAFTTGRVEQAQAMRPEITTVYYSAIMDQGTCEACAAMDGEELDLDTFASQVPNPRCAWPPYCRCEPVFAWRAAGQQEQEAA